MHAQGYAQDSLQIKVYTEITYQDKVAQDIKLLTVFCDYCSEKQTKGIGNEALLITYDERYNPENKLVNGKRLRTILISMSKDDFLAIDDEIEDENPINN